MDTLTMARGKKEVTPNRQLAQAILDQYHPKSVEDMQEALKDIFGPMFEAMLQGEMNSQIWRNWKQNFHPCLDIKNRKM